MPPFQAAPDSKALLHSAQYYDEIGGEGRSLPDCFKLPGEIKESKLVYPDYAWAAREQASFAAPFRSSISGVSGSGRF